MPGPSMELWGAAVALTQRNRGAPSPCGWGHLQPPGRHSTVTQAAAPPTAPTTKQWALQETEATAVAAACRVHDLPGNPGPQD
jgi:hypothetical protein